MEKRHRDFWTEEGINTFIKWFHQMADRKITDQKLIEKRLDELVNENSKTVLLVAIRNFVVNKGVIFSRQTLKEFTDNFSPGNFQQNDLELILEAYDGHDLRLEEKVELISNRAQVFLHKFDVSNDQIEMKKAILNNLFRSAQLGIKSTSQKIWRDPEPEDSDELRTLVQGILDKFERPELITESEENVGVSTPGRPGGKPKGADKETTENMVGWRKAERNITADVQITNESSPEALRRSKRVKTTGTSYTDLSGTSQSPKRRHRRALKWNAAKEDRSASIIKSWTRHNFYPGEPEPQPPLFENACSSGQPSPTSSIASSSFVLANEMHLFLGLLKNNVDEKLEDRERLIKLRDQLRRTQKTVNDEIDAQIKRCNLKLQ